LLDALLHLALAAHLPTMGAAAVGPLAAVGLEWRAARTGDAATETVARRLAAVCLLLFVAGMALGGCVVLLLWAERGPEYFDPFWRIPMRRWLFGIGELIFSLVCLAAYWGLWGRLRRRRAWHRWLAVLGATNLLYHFPPLFAAVAVLRQREPTGTAAVDYLALLRDEEVLARTAHHLLAAAVAAGVCVLLVADRAARSTATRSPSAARLGGWLVVAAGLLQVPAGLVLLAWSSPAARQRLLGGDLWAALWLVAGLLASLALLHYGAAAAFSGESASARRCAGLLMVVVLAMVAATRRAAEPNHAPVDTTARRVEAASAGQLPSSCPWHLRN
jgi:hypothetical protein